LGVGISHFCVVTCRLTYQDFILALIFLFIFQQFSHECISYNHFSGTGNAIQHSNSLWSVNYQFTYIPNHSCIVLLSSSVCLDDVLLWCVHVCHYQHQSVFLLSDHLRFPLNPIEIYGKARSLQTTVWTVWSSLYIGLKPIFRPSYVQSKIYT
jgi:hypothetical protein